MNNFWTLERFKEISKSWRFRIVRIRYSQDAEFTQGTVAKDLKWQQSKVSRILRSRVGDLKVCDFCAIEGYLAKKENELNLTPFEKARKHEEQ